MSDKSFCPIEKTLSGATTSDESRPRSNSNAGVLRNPQSSSIIGTSLSDCLVSCQDNSVSYLKTIIGLRTDCFKYFSRTSTIWKHLYGFKKLINNNDKNNDRTCRIVNIAVPDDHRAKLNEKETGDKYLDLAREVKKTMEHVVVGDPNSNWGARYCQPKDWYRDWMI